MPYHTRFYHKEFKFDIIPPGFEIAFLPICGKRVKKQNMCFVEKSLWILWIKLLITFKLKALLKVEVKSQIIRLKNFACV